MQSERFVSRFHQMDINGLHVYLPLELTSPDRVDHVEDVPVGTEQPASQLSTETQRDESSLNRWYMAGLAAMAILIMLTLIILKKNHGRVG